MMLKIHESDNVAVSLKGTATIAPGHKQALQDIPKGALVIKYGQPIGRTTEDIPEGAWVHTHNLRSHLDEQMEYHYEFCAQELQKNRQTFSGYRRSGRRAGIRNEIYIIPSVGCVNGVCTRLAAAAQSLVKDNLDGIYALTHPFGCSQLGQDHANIRRLLCAISQNPNAAFVLFVGLGCENNLLSGIKEELKNLSHDHILYLNCQDVEDEYAEGLDLLKDLAGKASKMEREWVDFSELCIGLKCGGSDAYSGLTANPLVGKICDRVVAAGGSAILTEVPEMFGAEQILMNKCVDRDVYNRYEALIRNFQQYYREQGFPVYENPSPGNKEGGITTLEEKSLGCIEKAGSTAIVDVLSYGEIVKNQGVSVLDGPGNDLIASTALAASGCQIVLFTTGRGTPFSTFVPTMKIASNTPMAEKKHGWIDFNAYTMNEDGLYSLLLDTINGTYRCKSEDIREIAFHKTGVTL